MTADLMQFNLEGKRALVTGGASGIGFGVCDLLVSSGATVAVNDLETSHHLSTALDALSVHPGKSFGVAGSVADAASVKTLVETTAEELGGLDYLINNAATPNTPAPIPPSDLDAMTESFWDTIIQTNLMSVFRMTHAAAPYLKASKGSVVSTASISAFGGGGSSLAYTTCKAGLLGLTRELARGLAPDVRVNSVAPGMVDSNWQCRFGDQNTSARDTVPLQRVGSPQDYAEAIVFLAASANYITGETLTVDGGWRA